MRDGSKFISFKIKRWDDQKGKFVWSGLISSGTTNPLVAQKTREEAQALEDSIRGNQDSKMTREKAFEMVNEILKWHGVPEIVDRKPEEQTWLEYSGSWMDDQKALKGETVTYKQYRSHLKQFTAFLEPDISIAAIERKHCQAFYNQLLKKRAAKTCRNIFTTIRMVFKQAVEDELISKSPAVNVKTAVVNSRQDDPFTLEDIALIREGLIDVEFAEEWKTVFLFGICLGSRLKDCSIRRWSEIELTGDMPHIVYVPRKTERLEKVVKVPLVDPLWSHLKSFGPRGEDFITPNLAQLPTNGRKGLSHIFMQVLKDKKVPMRVEAPKGKGGATWYSKGFHSTRHTLASLMAAQDVPTEIRMAVCGHSDKQVHHKYTHHDDKLMRDAVETSLRVVDF